MYYRIIDQDIKIFLSIPKFADELFSLTNKNRNFLRKWLPWLDSIKTKEDTKKFIILQLEKFAKGEALHQSIFYKENIVGVLGFNSIENGVGVIGYWLDKEHEDLGIMTKCVKELIKLGFEYLELKKVEIHCATHNKKSQAIPKRLGFKEEKNLKKDAEKLNGVYYDQLIYSLKRDALVF